ncbi:MAG: PIN domain-containing protein [Parvularculaceae bacterium]
MGARRAVKVVDASAILAVMLGERGEEKAANALVDGGVSVVNLTEVLQRLVRTGASPEGVALRLERGGVQWDRPTDEDAELVGRWSAIRGFSLADRFCVAAAKRLSAPVVTADRDWAGFGLPVQIEFIR